MTTPDMEVLRAFRSHVYRSIGCRIDALKQGIDAVLTTPVIESPAHLSVAATFQRQWGSVYDALNHGTVDLAALAEVLAHHPIPNGTR